MVNQLRNCTLAPSEKTQAPEYYSLLAKARAGTDKAAEQQPQHPPGPKHRKGDRGGGHTLDKNQEDAQDMPEAIKQKPHKIAKRAGSRDRSSSLEPDDLELFKSKHGEEKLAAVVLEMLMDEDATTREYARLLIRKCNQK
ncbi:hypothetical protein BGW39_004674 [Mortierella sp. 14UC]|nr:hypothetical protein BGW39_004674 [Mortierella sp. 14UC]